MREHLKPASRLCTSPRRVDVDGNDLDAAEALQREIKLWEQLAAFDSPLDAKP